MRKIMSNINQTQDLLALDTVQELDNETAAKCSGGVGYLFGRDPDLILYEHHNGEGQSIGANAATGDGIPNLDPEFNDRTSSIRILRGVWGFYEHAGYNGWRINGPQFVVLGPGYYNLEANNDIISSLKRLAP
jgi:Beta/Gamma crystallin